MRYSSEHKEAVLKKIPPQNNRCIWELARDEGISEATSDWNRKSILDVVVEAMNWRSLRAFGKEDG